MVPRRLGLQLSNLNEEDHRYAHSINRHRFGKTTFHLVALGERNKILLRKKCSRSQLLAWRHARERTFREPHYANRGTRCA